MINNSRLKRAKEVACLSTKPYDNSELAALRDGKMAVKQVHLLKFDFLIISTNVELNRNVYNCLV